MNISTEGDITVNAFDKFYDGGVIKYNIQVEGINPGTRGTVILKSVEFPTVQKNIKFNITW